MKVLDLDLDFFLNDIALHRSDYGERLSDDYRPWKEDEVTYFLTNHVGLKSNQKIKGRIINHHHEAFFFWRELINDEILSMPFEVTHIDAHADLGLGDGSWDYLMTKFLYLENKQKFFPERLNLKDIYKLNYGNYLAYAIACRWISNLIYVTHPRWTNDLPWTLLKDFSDSSGAIQLKKYEQGISLDVLNMKKYIPVEYEPEVPLGIVSKDDFRGNGDYDFIVLCKSPGYTPKASDYLIDTFSNYIEEI